MLELQPWSLLKGATLLALLVSSYPVSSAGKYLTSSFETITITITVAQSSTADLATRTPHSFIPISGNPAIYVSGSGYAFKGCYAMPSQGDRRILGGYVLPGSIPQTNLTVDECLVQCSSVAVGSSVGHYEHAAIEMGRDCICGMTLLAAAEKVDESNCSVPCPGDTRVSCGGTDNAIVYSYSTQPPSEKLPDELLKTFTTTINGAPVTSTGPVAQSSPDVLGSPFEAETSTQKSTKSGTIAAATILMGILLAGIIVASVVYKRHQDCNDQKRNRRSIPPSPTFTNPFAKVVESPIHEKVKSGAGITHGILHVGSRSGIGVITTITAYSKNRRPSNIRTEGHPRNVLDSGESSAVGIPENTTPLSPHKPVQWNRFDSVTNHAPGPFSPSYAVQRRLAIIYSLETEDHGYGSHRGAGESSAKLQETAANYNRTRLLSEASRRSSDTAISDVVGTAAMATKNLQQIKWKMAREDVRNKDANSSVSVSDASSAYNSNRLSRVAEVSSDGDGVSPRISSLPVSMFRLSFTPQKSERSPRSASQRYSASSVSETIRQGNGSSPLPLPSATKTSHTLKVTTSGGARDIVGPAPVTEEREESQPAVMQKTPISVISSSISMKSPFSTPSDSPTVSLSDFPLPAGVPSFMLDRVWSKRYTVLPPPSGSYAEHRRQSLQGDHHSGRVGRRQVSDEKPEKDGDDQDEGRPRPESDVFGPSGVSVISGRVIEGSAGDASQASFKNAPAITAFATVDYDMSRTSRSLAMSKNSPISGGLSHSHSHIPGQEVASISSPLTSPPSPVSSISASDPLSPTVGDESEISHGSREFGLMLASTPHLSHFHFRYTSSSTAAENPSRRSSAPAVGTPLQQQSRWSWDSDDLEISQSPVSSRLGQQSLPAERHDWGLDSQFLTSPRNDGNSVKSPQGKRFSLSSLLPPLRPGSVRFSLLPAPLTFLSVGSGAESPGSLASRRPTSCNTGEMMEDAPTVKTRAVFSSLYTSPMSSSLSNAPVASTAVDGVTGRPDTLLPVAFTCTPGSNSNLALPKPTHHSLPLTPTFTSPCPAPGKPTAEPWRRSGSLAPGMPEYVHFPSPPLPLVAPTPKRRSSLIPGLLTTGSGSSATEMSGPGSPRGIGNGVGSSDVGNQRETRKPESGGRWSPSPIIRSSTAKGIETPGKIKRRSSLHLFGMPPPPKDGKNFLRPVQLDNSGGGDGGDGLENVISLNATSFSNPSSDGLGKVAGNGPGGEGLGVKGLRNRWSRFVRVVVGVSASDEKGVVFEKGKEKKVEESKRGSAGGSRSRRASAGGRMTESTSTNSNVSRRGSLEVFFSTGSRRGSAERNG